MELRKMFQIMKLFMKIVSQRKSFRSAAEAAFDHSDPVPFLRTLHFVGADGLGIDDSGLNRFIAHLLDIRDCAVEIFTVVEIAAGRKPVGSAEIGNCLIRINDELQHMSVGVGTASVGCVDRCLGIHLYNGNRNAGIQNEIIAGADFPKRICQRDTDKAVHILMSLVEQAPMLSDLNSFL